MFKHEAGGVALERQKLPNVITLGGGRIQSKQLLFKSIILLGDKFTPDFSVWGIAPVMISREVNKGALDAASKNCCGLVATKPLCSRFKYKKSIELWHNMTIKLKDIKHACCILLVSATRLKNKLELSLEYQLLTRKMQRITHVTIILIHSKHDYLDSSGLI